MEYSKKQILLMIKNAIISNKDDVIAVLKKSNIDVPDNVSGNDLLDLVMTNIINGNGYLMYNMTVLLTHLEDLERKKYSNVVVTAIVTAATAVYQGLSSWVASDKAKYEANQEAERAEKLAKDEVEIAKTKKQNQIIINEIKKIKEKTKEGSSKNRLVNIKEKANILLPVIGVSSLILISFIIFSNKLIKN